MQRDKLICITGGAGFIGSGVLRLLNDLGYNNIVIVDQLGHSEKWKNLVTKKFSDIIDKDLFFPWLEDHIEEVAAFVHLGACSSTVETNASYLLENNYRFSVKLAEYALKHEKRMVYASSAATYGDGSLGFVDDEEALDLLEPLNMYGYSKHLFDLWAKREGVLSSLTGLKYFNVFGPNENHKGRMSSAIPKLLPQILETGKVQLFKSNDPEFADGGQMRDFIYVKDAAQATVDFLFSEKGGIYNVGTGKAHSWNELATAIFDALQLPAKIEYCEMPLDLNGKYQNFTQADMQKSLKALKNWSARPLTESVREYVQDYLILGNRW